MSQTYTRWNLSPSDLLNLTPVKARDLVTRCLLEAQRETFALNEQRLGHKTEDANLQSIVEGAVRLAFRESQQDYNNPTPEGLMKVVQLLAMKSSGWGTPPEIIEHHKQQIMRVLQALGKN
jgi:hypothetical protein